MTEETLFSDALKLPPDERAGFLAAACSDDDALRRRVEVLLSAYDPADHFLEPPAALNGQTGPYVSDDLANRLPEQPGTRIGPYRLLQQIGEGGMGVVFMAEQEHPVRRKVALKVLKPGMDTRQVVARFEAERQALALMDHPNIAHIFDAGHTNSGRPFFVMELVRGVPVTDFCDQNHLSIRERLELFVSVCQAVQYAHHKGVIHRDLKPSNILVTMYDATPVVKVIDFGIAKATGQQLTEKTLFTNFAQFLGTPMYMSPEQAQMSGLDVDTRSDVYALGVLLYELLTGTTPFDAERLRTAAYDEIRRIIREEEPARPSTRMSTLGDAAGTVSANRRGDPKGLSQVLRGELDWIVMRALEKDRTRRYESASAFAADVNRYLNDEPVLACPPAMGYRLRKLVRRYKGPVAAAALVALALVGGIIGTTWGMIRATYAEAEAVAAATLKDEALQGQTVALTEAQERLFQSLVHQARAERGSRRVGQRFEALKALRQAAQIRVTPELRAEAAAALVLPDLELAHEWDVPPGTVAVATGVVPFDESFRKYVRLDRDGAHTICRYSGGREEVVARLPAHGRPPFRGVFISPDGRFVAIWHGGPPEERFGAVRVMRLDGLTPTVVFDEPDGLISGGLDFHRNGRWVAMGHGDSVSVYDLVTARRTHRWPLGGEPINLAFHPRDGRLAVACGNAVRMLDADSGAERPALRGDSPPGLVHNVSWHPNGRLVAAGCNDRKIHIWDAESAAEVMTPWVGHTGDGMYVAFNHAGDRLISADWSGQSHLWDTATGQRLLTIPRWPGLTFSADDRLVGAQLVGDKVQLWRLAAGREVRVLRRRGADAAESIKQPVVDPAGRTVAAQSGNWLVFFNLTDGRELAAVAVPRADTARPVGFDRSAGWITGGLSGLLLWPVRSDPARPGAETVGPAREVTSGFQSTYTCEAAVSADGRVLAVPQGDSTVVVHRGDPERRVVLGPQYDVRHVAVSPDGRWVATGSHWSDGRSKFLRIWDADTGRQVHELPLDSSTYPDFSPDGRWLITSTLGSGSALWDAGTWNEIRRYPARGVFSPDSRLLALSAGVGVIQLVEPVTGREVARLTGPDPVMLSPACFTPDGTVLVAGCVGDTALYVWDLRSLRTQLADLGLDWDWPPFPPADASGPPVPRHLEVRAGELIEPAPTAEDQARHSIELSRRAFEANPDSAKDCNNLAWLYVTGPEALRDVKAAVPLAEKAVRLAPGDANFVNTLGVAYYRDGQYVRAVETLRPNLRRQQDRLVAFDLYFLAMSYHRLGDAERARDHFDLAARAARAHRGLPAGHLAELDAFRREAEALLSPGPDARESPPETGPPAVHAAD